MQEALDPEITGWLAHAIQQGVDQAERNQALTATVSLSCSIAYDPEVRAVEIKITTKDGKGVKHIARVVNGQLKLNMAGV